jgi:hypothetical protein
VVEVVGPPGAVVVVVLDGVVLLGGPGRDVVVALDGPPVPAVVEAPETSTELDVDSWGAVVSGGAVLVVVEVTTGTRTDTVPGEGDRTSR